MRLDASLQNGNASVHLRHKIMKVMKNILGSQKKQM